MAACMAAGPSEETQVTAALLPSNLRSRRQPASTLASSRGRGGRRGPVTSVSRRDEVEEENADDDDDLFGPVESPTQTTHTAVAVSDNVDDPALPDTVTVVLPQDKGKGKAAGEPTSEPTSEPEQPEASPLLPPQSPPGRYPTSRRLSPIIEDVLDAPPVTVTPAPVASSTQEVPAGVPASVCAAPQTPARNVAFAMSQAASALSEGDIENGEDGSDVDSQDEIQDFTENIDNNPAAMDNNDADAAAQALYEYDEELSRRLNASYEGIFDQAAADNDGGDGGVQDEAESAEHWMQQARQVAEAENSNSRGWTTLLPFEGAYSLGSVGAATDGNEDSGPVTRLPLPVNMERDRRLLVLLRGLGRLLLRRLDIAPRPLLTEVYQYIEQGLRGDAPGASLMLHEQYDLEAPSAASPSTRSIRRVNETEARWLQFLLSNSTNEALSRPLPNGPHLEEDKSVDPNDFERRP
ncbi:hypothetical protein Sste5344_001719 [Sporothrix stenoceras]